MSDSPAANVKILIVPGLYNSGPEHWQRIWAKQNPGFGVIEQRNWDTPSCEDWISTIDDAVRKSSEPVLLIGHSLGSIAIVHWASVYKRSLAGALLVAPSDTEELSFPPGTSGFSPIPLAVLQFPSIMVVSNNDHYLSLPRAHQLAGSWGSSLVDLGPKGHISVADGFGPWPEGLAYVEQLSRTL